MPSTCELPQGSAPGEYLVSFSFPILASSGIDAKVGSLGLVRKCSREGVATYVGPIYVAQRDPARNAMRV